ncbi:MAG: type II secretion system F family protein [Candidatus Aenigmarchaeota archaeon]|nr:type II secretion system F family protein [Candidatus Aenigmarchaeota archaeon]
MKADMNIRALWKKAKDLYKKSIRFFARFGIKHFPNYLKPIKQEIEQSNLRMVYETYVGKMFFFTFLSFFLIFDWMLVLLVFVAGIEPTTSLIGSLLFSLITSLIILVTFHSYPFQKISSKKSSIEAVMPFAINHMAAISSSGVPPYVMFKLLRDIKEYEEISNEAKVITRNVETFGMDITSAIKQVASRTPSDEFRQFLFGIVSTIDTGGSLTQYLKNAAKEALFNYRLKREHYLSTLSTYADLYTAVMIAAPLFFISILSVMSLIGGRVMGMDITDAMKIGVYGVIPMLNTIFIMFLHFTQPRV